MIALLASLALATLVSEDLACITAGVFAAEGRVGFWAGAAACFAGIYAGDLALFVAGRTLGRRALGRAPLSWFLSERDVERSSRWLEERGGRVVLFSRFVPGTRLPTYFAAGALRTSAARFSLLFLVATALWTPALVGLAMLVGAEALEAALAANRDAALALAGAALGALLVARLATALASARGRRLLAARLGRVRRWEFWPPWAFYPPVVAYVLTLAVRHRGATLFTAANPAIADGGFVGESKSAILAGLSGSGDRVARFRLLGAGLDAAARVAAARDFLDAHGLDFPVVVKPDVGQRGEGVAIVRSGLELEREIRARDAATIVQEFVPGHELGIFYVRHPAKARGRIFSITEKRFPEVTGDGRRTLEELILADDRAVLTAAAHLERHRARLGEVPAAGELVPLVEIGSHCRGAIFLDGARLGTPALEAAIDELSRGFEGFHFGRYDVRVSSLDELGRGAGFKVVELNGVTSEATHIYDPANGIADAYRVLFEQWRIAFEIGAANRALGVAPTPLGRLARRVAAFAAGR